MLRSLRSPRAVHRSRALFAVAMLVAPLASHAQADDAREQRWAGRQEQQFLDARVKP